MRSWLVPVADAQSTLGRLSLADIAGARHRAPFPAARGRPGSLERGDYGPSAEPALKICEFFELPFEAVFSLRPFTPMSRQLYRPVDPGNPALSIVSLRWSTENDFTLSGGREVPPR